MIKPPTNALADHKFQGHLEQGNGLWSPVLPDDISRTYSSDVINIFCDDRWELLTAFTKNKSHVEVNLNS